MCKSAESNPVGINFGIYICMCTFILQSRRSKTNAEARVITLALCINYVLTWWPGQERPAHLELKCSNTTLVCTFKCNTANKQCLLWFLPSLWQALTIGQRLVQIPMTGFPHIFDFNMYVQYAAEVPAVLSCQRLHFLCATAVRNWVFHAWPMFCCRYWVLIESWEAHIENTHTAALFMCLCCCQIPGLVSLKRHSAVVFVGIDTLDDIRNNSYNELFVAGGCIVSDELVLSPDCITHGRSENQKAAM